MKTFFELNHPLWRMMGLLSDFMMLTLIWAVFSFPIITLGPSTVAFSHVGMKLAEQSGKGVVKEFIEVFLNKFKSTFLFGLATVLTGLFLFIDMKFLYSFNQAISTFFLFVILFISILCVFMLIYIYPLLGIMEINKKKIMTISFFMSLKYLKWTVFLFIMDGFLLFLTFYIAPYIVFFTIGGIAYLNGKVIHMILEENPALVNEK
ncbi:DUF624 domain-containing protein [Jeotgalibaca sp. MA1X17-3]|uniref:YesL family protein n=1 Tax=Jeotgalibaca sp. MA1X17-3 TaxID=2908211 RepID=UPI001F3F599D|nr:DUF624 domain-containing protein [Jeotgalibaca sp. MA1X17-3]UJF15690.1 DUF624 domain-containing protein [Jeotgalibaca sp. MA1X17-3]